MNVPFLRSRIACCNSVCVCITGNGLKTTEVMQDSFEVHEPIRPKLAEFDAFIQSFNGHEPRIETAPVAPVTAV